MIIQPCHGNPCSIRKNGLVQGQESVTKHKKIGLYTGMSRFRRPQVISMVVDADRGNCGDLYYANDANENGVWTSQNELFQTYD